MAEEFTLQTVQTCNHNHYKNAYMVVPSLSTSTYEILYRNERTIKKQISPINNY